MTIRTSSIQAHASKAPLKDRLAAACEKGGLTTADLEVWFELPYQTMRSYRGGVNPYPARRPQIETRLKLLEAAVDGRRHFPVPLNIRWSDRKEYIRGVFERVRHNR